MAEINLKLWLPVSSIVLLGIGALFGIYIWSERTGSPATTAKPLALSPGNAEVVARGKQIYTQNCAACHGADLKGQANWMEQNSEGKLPAPPHDQSGHTWHHGDRLLFDLTKFGMKKFTKADYKTDMPAFNGILSDQDIIAALSYIKSTWPAQIRSRHDLLNESLRQQESQKNN